MNRIQHIALSLLSITILGISGCGSNSGSDRGAFFTTPTNQQNNTNSPLQVYVFSPPMMFNGNLGGRAGADQICETYLPVGLDSDYQTHALLAFNSLDDLTSFFINYNFPTDEIIYSHDNEMIIANSLNDLLDGNINATMRDAGLLAANTIYWTGFDPDGRLSQDSCNGFTSSDAIESGQIGNSNYTDVRWSAFQVDNCSGFHPILCIAF
jgi:hypothetical protein